MTYTVDTHTPVPYQLCACSICRKVGGYSGSVNLGAIASTLDIKTGSEQIRKYKAIASRGTPEERRVNSERAFCGTCSSMLWVFDDQWPELIHPFASVVDHPQLPSPEEMVCCCADSKPAWVRWPEGEKKVFQRFSDGDESIDA